jgi:hypothetical protein
VHSRFGENRGIWLVGGVLLGLGVSYFWPHEPIRADQADRNEKFAMISVAATSAIAGLPGTEAIFILDFVTGRLQGFYLAPNVGNLTQSFYRDVAADLKLDEKGAAQPVYAVVGGQGQIAGQSVTFGAGMIYVAELTTGSLVGYAFPFTAQNNGVPPQQMIPVARAQFRQPIAN